MENQLHFSVENMLYRSEKPPENVCCKFCIITVTFYTTIADLEYWIQLLFNFTLVSVGQV